MSIGKITTIHGCIFGTPGPISNTEQLHSVIQRNTSIIENLPQEDEHPSLTQNMFSITANNFDEPGFYKYQMIHFAASYNHLDEVWSTWLQKFEDLLKKLTWNRVDLELNLEWAPDGFEEKHYSYQWKKKLGIQKITTAEDWIFEGGPRDFKKKKE